MFIDAGAFIGRALPRDQHHDEAIRIWKNFSTDDRYFTSNLILGECLMFFARNLSFPYAVREIRQIMSSNQLEVLRPQQEDEAAALELFEKYADNRIGFIDCLTAALMRRHRIKRIFTFDRHFARMGFIDR